MINNKVSLEIVGDIQLDEFTKLILHFGDLVKTLSDEIGGESHIHWNLDTLQYNSPALIEWQGHSSEIEIVENVVGAVETIGRSLENGEAIPYGEKIRNAAIQLAKVPNGKISTIILGSNRYQATITSKNITSMPTPRPSEVASYGQVAGIAETLTRRRGYAVTIYDELFEMAVQCHFSQDQEADMLGMWGKRVLISGYITRDAYSGRPKSIREISNVEFLPDPDEEAFLLAKGSIQRSRRGESAEQEVRRFRNAY